MLCLLSAACSFSVTRVVLLPAEGGRWWVQSLKTLFSFPLSRKGVESLSVEISQNHLNTILCCVLQDDPAEAGSGTPQSHCGPFQPQPTCDYLSKPPNLSKQLTCCGAKGKAEGLLSACTKLILTTDAIPWTCGRQRGL